MDAETDSPASVYEKGLLRRFGGSHQAIEDYASEHKIPVEEMNRAVREAPR